jgi:REP element-mobilizing transposase RayT
VFLDKVDYELFLSKMTEVCSRTGWKIHAYVLMPNHFHWLLETPEPNLVAGMKWFMGAYSQSFNARHGQRGHVFQGRYKALPVESGVGSYFETVSTYIHLNPARSKLPGVAEAGLEKYAWSSYSLYMAPKKRPAWLEVSRVLGNLGWRDDQTGRSHYGAYLRGRVQELRTDAGRKLYNQTWKAIRYGWCLGGQGFQEKILDLVGSRLEGKERESYSGEVMQRHDEREAEALLRKGMKALGVEEDSVMAGRKGSLTKSVLAWHVHRRAMVSHKWISARLGMGCPSNLTTHINRIKQASDGEVLKVRRKLEKV